MAVNIRLTPQIDSLARAYCERVGISINSLVGVALDAYLQRPKSDPCQVEPEPQGVPAEAAAVVPETVRTKLAKFAGLRAAAVGAAAPASIPAKEPHERPTLTAAPWKPPEPKPTLSAKPSKAERAKLADWYRRNPTK